MENLENSNQSEGLAPSNRRTAIADTNVEHSDEAANAPTGLNSTVNDVDEL